MKCYGFPAGFGCLHLALVILKARGERMTHIMFETFCVSDMSDNFDVSAVEDIFPGATNGGTSVTCNPLVNFNPS